MSDKNHDVSVSEMLDAADEENIGLIGRPAELQFARLAAAFNEQKAEIARLRIRGDPMSERTFTASQIRSWFEREESVFKAERAESAMRSLEEWCDGQAKVAVSPCVGCVHNIGVNINWCRMGMNTEAASCCYRTEVARLPPRPSPEWVAAQRWDGKPVELTGECRAPKVGELYRSDNGIMLSPRIDNETTWGAWGGNRWIVRVVETGTPRADAAPRGVQSTGNHNRHLITYSPDVKWRLDRNLITRETAISILTEPVVLQIEDRYEAFAQTLAIEPRSPE